MDLSMDLYGTPMAYPTDIAPDLHDDRGNPPRQRVGRSVAPMRVLSSVSWTVSMVASPRQFGEVIGKPLGNQWETREHHGKASILERGVAYPMHIDQQLSGDSCCLKRLDLRNYSLLHLGDPSGCWIYPTRLA